MNEANDEIPHDIPVLVPKRFGSGQRLGKTAAGKVTRPAEPNPQKILIAISPLREVIDIQEKQITLDTAVQQSQVKIGPR